VDAASALRARNRGSYELRERLKARGGKDPAEFLSDIISNLQRKLSGVEASQRDPNKRRFESVQPEPNRRASAASDD
jgi:hypothetical protein